MNGNGTGGRQLTPTYGVTDWGVEWQGIPR